MEAATNLWHGDAYILEDEAVADAENNWQSATSKGWEEFKKTLTPISASLAELLWMMWAGAYDEELSLLAGQSLNGPSQPWHKYLNPEQKGEADRSALQQWNLYVSAVMAKPKAFDEQRILSDIVADEIDDAGHSTKENLQKIICELRKRKVTFSAAAGALSGAAGAYLKAVGAFFEQSRTGKKWK